MPLNHAQLCALIPHADAMCLLHTVESWDQDSIVCTAVSHRDAASPLRLDGGVPALCGIEFGAQAMAVHGGLLAGGSARRGFLASVRNVQLAVTTLDECGPLLTVQAVRLLNNEANQMYEFNLRDGERLLVSGRAAVFLQ